MREPPHGLKGEFWNWSRLLARGGVLALLLSALFLWLSGYVYQPGVETSPWSFALLMLVARTFGVAAFGCGAALLAFRAWTPGTLLIIGSIVLPCIAFTYFGVI